MSPPNLVDSYQHGPRSVQRQDDRHSLSALMSSKYDSNPDQRIVYRATRWRLFKIGKLHFGKHGLGGLVCLAGTIWAWHTPPHAWYYRPLLLSSQLTSFVLVQQATVLLPQVPPYTQILPGVVAPHRQAFQRTIATMQYLIVRVLCYQIAPLVVDNGGQWTVQCVTIVLLLWRYYPLVPHFDSKASWTQNGNTWIFVLPMWIGTTGDLWQFLWYGDLMDASCMLQIQVAGLLLAFGFTLGFRGYVPMPIVYFIAAAAVWTLLEQGTRRIQQS